MVSSDHIINIIKATLGIQNRQIKFNLKTRLLGNIPEFDSSTVVAILEAVEQKYDIVFDDDEITAEIFETVETFTKFLEGKI